MAVVEQRSGGAAGFLDVIREALRNGTYQPSSLGNRLSRSLKNRGSPYKWR
jgi:hypothetical protein